MFTTTKLRAIKFQSMTGNEGNAVQDYCLFVYYIVGNDVFIQHRNSAMSISH